MSELIKIENRGHTAILTLNNPPANTWTPESLMYVKQVVDGLNADKNNYALVVASENAKFFSAGADLVRFNHQDAGLAFEFSQAFGQGIEALTRYQGVSIAAITGFAMGGGLETALACDIRLCEEHSQMALPEASVGLLPCGLGTQHLPRLVGEQWAKRMILLGERLNAEKAKEIGLVSEVVPTGTVLDRALELAAMAEKQSPTSLRYCKELIMASRNSEMAANLYRERELFVRLWENENQIEGVGAFVEKRKPVWKNE